MVAINNPVIEIPVDMVVVIITIPEIITTEEVNRIIVVVAVVVGKLFKIKIICQLLPQEEQLE